MSAHYSAFTVLGSVLLVLSALCVALATAGGLPLTALRDLPWFVGRLSIPRKPSVDVTISLWQYCLNKGTEFCYSLSDPDSPLGLLLSTQDVVADVTGDQQASSSVSSSGTFPSIITYRPVLPTTYLTALPYIHCAAAGAILIAVVASLSSKPPSAAYWAMFGTIGSALGFGTAFYFVWKLRQDVPSSLLQSPTAWAPAMWISGAGFAGALLGFLVFASVACCGNWRRPKRYEAPLYY